MYKNVGSKALRSGIPAMSVESFDPSRDTIVLEGAVLAELLRAAGRLDEPMFGLDRLAVARLAPAVRQGRADWEAAARGLDNAGIEALIRLFTLGEKLPGWESGANSPVVPLAVELKARNAYPKDLTRWIRSNSDNRYLPHGNLLDRL